VRRPDPLAASVGRPRLRPPAPDGCA